MEPFARTAIQPGQLEQKMDTQHARTLPRSRHSPTLEGLEDGSLVLRDPTAALQRLRDKSLSRQWARPRRADLAQAVAGWMSLAFVVSYVVLPAITAALGATLNLVPLAASGAAFVVMLAGVVGLVSLLRPSIRLPQQRKADSAPEIAATAGSLAVWAGAHQLLFVLEPLTAMGAAALLPFVLMNLVESSLFGVMLASFTRSAPKAFALGALFQLLFLLLTLFFFAL